MHGGTLYFMMFLDLIFVQSKDNLVIGYIPLKCLFEMHRKTLLPTFVMYIPKQFPILEVGCIWKTKLNFELITLYN